MPRKAATPVRISSATQWAKMDSAMNQPEMRALAASICDPIVEQINACAERAQSIRAKNVVLFGIMRLQSIVNDTIALKDQVAPLRALKEFAVVLSQMEAAEGEAGVEDVWSGVKGLPSIQPKAVQPTVNRA